MVVFLKEFFEKVDFFLKSKDNKKHAKFPRRQNADQPATKGRNYLSLRKKNHNLKGVQDTEAWL